MTIRNMQSISRSGPLRALLGGLLVATLLSACGGGNGAGAVVPAATSSPSTASPPANPALVPPGTPTAVELVPPAPAITPAQPAKSLKEQIADAENSGKYPKLDRSSDIAGPDANHNGVRDDIETWINAQDVTDVQRKALMQKAKSLQQTLLVDLKDNAALQHADDQLAASSNCGLIQFKPYVTFSNFAGKIEAITANTRERAMRYMQYNNARSGSSTTIPDGDTCEK